MILPLLIAIVVSFVAFNALLKDVDELAHENTQELLPVVALQSEVQEIITILHEQNNPLDEYLGLDQKVTRIDQQIDTLLKTKFDDEDELASIQRLHRRWKQVRDLVQAIPLLKAEQNATLLRELDSELFSMRAELDRIIGIISQEVELILAAAGETRDRAGVQVGLTLMLALVMASLFGHFLAQSILRPLDQLREGAEHFGKGDFKHRITIESRDELGRVSYAFNRMAVRLDRSLRSLRRLSTRDYLTNLFNAREFYRQLDGEMERAQRYNESFSLLLIDADHFKQINDSYGHQVGDKVLRALAKVLSIQVRNVDVAARVGGEEFAVVLPNTSGEAALAIAERIRREIFENQVVLNDEQKSTIEVSVSIGLATYPRSGQSAKELFHQADMALYNAKQGGRNRVSIA